MAVAELKSFRAQFEKELKDILNYWMEHTVDTENGGFHGYLTAGNAAVKGREKSAVLNTRILWTFAAAYRAGGDVRCLPIAERAFEYIRNHFIDREYGGVYWMLDCNGNPTVTKKQVYAQAFAIYGLSEYYLATRNRESLDMAIGIYEKLERYAWEKEYGGYLEALCRDWSATGDMQLSSNALETAEKSMNTHLHVLEAYTNLYRAWKDEKLKARLGEIIEIMRGRILDAATGAFKLFFDRSWKNLADIVSYGHDIEGSWLLCEAAEVLGDEEFLKSVEETAKQMAKHVLADGFDHENGGIYNETADGVLDTDKVWWVQAEAVVGFLNAYRLTGEQAFLDAALKCWEFIIRFIKDPTGEWVWQVTREGGAFDREEKVGPWKCPYHNSRMCLQAVLLIDQLTK